MFLLYVLTPYFAVTLIFGLFQRKLLYPATKTARLRAEEIVGDVVASDVQLHTADGLTLHGWHFQSEQTDSASHPLLILYFPGNSGCRSNRVHDCRDFTRHGCDVLLFDYRGYGDNPGSPGEEHLADDARRGWTFATRELNVPSERIILFGESLGGAVAVRLAAELSIAGEPPAGLILNSTFASLSETVAWHYPAFPFQFLLLDRYPSVDRISRVTCPLYQFHGTEDEFIPLRHARRLFAAAPPQSPTGVPKRFTTIEGGTHNSIPRSSIKSIIAEFLEDTRDDSTD